MTITEQHKKELYKYILGILNNKRCYLHRMNGMANHIHMLIDLHPAVALAELVKDIKQASNYWLKQNSELFPLFDCWGEGYYAVSVGVDGLEECRSYIINQEQHHMRHDLIDEMEWMATTNGMAWHEDDWA